MREVIFEKLIVEEAEQVRGGLDPSTPVAACTSTTQASRACLPVPGAGTV
ncbi:MAG: hypothetical protein GY950_24145 [bacterium]|nr:hypothetical protein [bacterium]